MIWFPFQTFITGSSGSSSNNGAAGAGGDAGLVGTMRASDLEALRSYKRKKLNVRFSCSCQVNTILSTYVWCADLITFLYLFVS